MSNPRRDFLKTAAAACAVAALPKLSAADAAADKAQEYYELRAYRLREGASTASLERYLEKALLPALKARKIGPVGVFTQTSVEPATAAKPALWVLIPYADLATFADVSATLHRSSDVVNAAGEYFTAATRANPAFDRIDVELMLAFAGQPRLRLPAAGRVNTRIFELRTYEDYSETKALKKIDMFNNGEIEAMHEVGLSPIFYGQTIAGVGLPHLTYMTSGPNLEAHQEHWKAFGGHPTWQKLLKDPQYADTVTRITKWMLAPTSYSEI